MNQDKPLSNREAKKLYRSRTDRMIAGVCGGLGEYFNTDPVLVRLIFLVSIFFGGFGIFMYLILMLIIPLEPGSGSGNAEVKTDEKVQEFAQEIKGRAHSLAEEFKEHNHEGWFSEGRNIIGTIIVLLGVGFLLNQILPFRVLRWDLIWPAIIILIGLFIVFKSPSKK